MPEISTWKPLYRIGGIAALLAAVLFRRNLGAEVSLFTGMETVPQSVVEWYALLQSNPFIGLAFLSVFDLVNYALVGLIFLALGAASWQAHKSLALIAFASGLMGIAVSFASNHSFSMLSLSQQYATASSEAQKSALLAAGQSILVTLDPLATWPATGVYVSLLLIALAGLLFSIIMLHSNRATAIVGLLASGCDLVYCMTFAIAPTLQVVWLASGGLFYMIWHLLIARSLLKRSKE
jgi:predicted membrane channel-forming protein YqfA (hemolysin III family)